MEPHVQHDADGAPEQVHQLKETLFGRAIVARLAHQLLAVERPPFHHDRRPEMAADLRAQSLRRHELQVVARIGLVRHHRGDAVAAVATALLGRDLGRLRRVGSGHVEPSALSTEVDRRRLVRRERHERHQERRRGNQLHQRRRDRYQVALRGEPARPVQLASVDVEQLLGGRRVVPQLVHQLAPRPGSQLRRERPQLGRGLLLQVQPVAPQLGRPGHHRVLEVQPAGELRLADGKGVGIGARLDLVAQRGAEALESLERRAGRRLEITLQPRRLGAEDPGELHHQLPTTTQHGEGRIDEHRRRLGQRGAAAVEKGRHGAQPIEHGRRAPTRGAVAPGQHGVQALEQMIGPEHRVPLVRALVLEPEDRAPELAEERGAVDLVLHVLDVELLHRAGHRAQGGEVLAHRLRVEAPEPAIVRDEAGRARRGRVEMVFEVQIGPAELIDRRHRRPE